MNKFSKKKKRTNLKEFQNERILKEVRNLFVQF